MMPNIDPKDLKRMMEKMGITSSEIVANRVVIECADKDIVVANPSITLIEMHGTKSFQISGDISESSREAAPIEISEDDVNFVAERTGVADKELVRKALADANGDIAQAILKLKGAQ